MDFEIDKYNQYNLRLGTKYSICPICSKNRTKKNQKCMMLDWKTAIGTCQHCGEVIQLHSYKRNKDINNDYYNERRTRNTKSLTEIETKLTKSLTKHNTIMPTIQTTYIDYKMIMQSRNGFSRNNLLIFLIKIFGHVKAKDLSAKYLLGTAKHWKGATVFWQIDSQLKVRTGKIMLYEQISGKRIKQPFNHIAWVHKVLGIPNFNLEQCFFGEHLINNYKKIAIVESEKTAIIASGYIPQFIWLAVGSLNNLSVNKCRVLEGKTIVLYPDLNAYDKWKLKAEQIEKEINIKFIISDLLEVKAEPEDKKQGFDLADYLIKHNWRDKNMTEDMVVLDEFIDENSDFKDLINELELELK